MTLRMADGPVASLPAGMDAYAGYVDQGGDGITYPAVLAAFPNALHLSISIHGAPAMCGDVENGALSSWAGFTYGYCAISNVVANIAAFGRPPKLWTAHYTDTAHICDQSCFPGLPAGFQADGTQWTDHGGVYDESLLADDFFTLAPVPIPTPGGIPKMGVYMLDPQTAGDPTLVVVDGVVMRLADRGVVGKLVSNPGVVQIPADHQMITDALTKA